MKKNIVILILILLIVIALTGCSDSVFDSEYKEFKESYVLSTSFVEEDNDSLKAIKKMDICMVESELKNMKVSMEKIAGRLSSKTEQGIYGNLETYYQGLEFLVYAAKNIDQLTIEEKRKVYGKALFVINNRRSIMQGDK